MGEIVNTRVVDETTLVIEVKVNYEEALRLQGERSNIQLIPGKRVADMANDAKHL